MGERRNGYEVSLEKPDGKRQPEGTRRRWKYNNKMFLI
jgi:hypothetical protein